MQPIRTCPHSFWLFIFILVGCATLSMTAAANRGYCETVVFCGFESAGTTWSYTYSGADYSSSNVGAADFPSNQRVLNDPIGSTQSWQVNGSSTSILKFSDPYFDPNGIQLSGWKDVAVKFRLSSTAISSNGGHTPNDNVMTYVALTDYSNQSAPAFSSTPDVTIKGQGAGARWGYNSGAPQQSVDVESGSILQPAEGGLRTDDGYTDIAIRVPNGKRSLAFKIYAKNDNGGKYWNFDNIALEGTATTSNSRWWDGDGQGPVGGGSGVWDNVAATKRWASESSGSTYSAWDAANGDNAYFTQSGGTVTVASATTVSARNLIFAAGGYKITAGDSASKLALTNGGTGGEGPSAITVANAGDTAEVNVSIIGNPGVGITKTGPGALVLGGANSYTGQTAIRGGVLNVSRSVNLGAAGTKVSLDGGALQFSTPVDLAAEHPLAVQSGGGTIDTQGYACSALTDGWSGAGALTKTGAGTLQLNGGSGCSFSGPLSVHQGTLKFGANNVLSGCRSITLDAGATLDVTAVAGYRLGAASLQTLEGSGNVLGNLQIDSLGTHDVGSSPGVQHVQGNYTMAGTLSVELSGNAPGDDHTGYDQVVVAGPSPLDVLLSGTLSLTWDGTGWSQTDDKLWILRNDTAGALTGRFSNYADNEMSIGVYDGRPWQIYYGADYSPGGGALTGGNDVLLLAAAPVPEPSAFVLLLIAAGALWLLRACHHSHSKPSDAP